VSKVTGFWSFAGLVVVVIFGANLLAHPAATQSAENAATGLEKTTGNQILGKTG
jgi:hypothetical protein